MMEIIFHRDLSVKEKEKIRQVSGYYRGIASFENDRVLVIQPKDSFLEKEFIDTLQSLNIPFKNVDVIR